MEAVGEGATEDAPGERLEQGRGGRAGLRTYPEILGRRKPEEQVGIGERRALWTGNLGQGKMGAGDNPGGQRQVAAGRVFTEMIIHTAESAQRQRVPVQVWCVCELEFFPLHR